MKKRNPIYTAGSFLLAGALTLSMAACSAAQAPAEATQTPSATATPAATAAPAEETAPSTPVSGALPVKALQPKQVEENPYMAKSDANIHHDGYNTDSTDEILPLGIYPEIHVSYETTNPNASPAIYFDSYGHAVVPLLGGIAIRDLNAEETKTLGYFSPKQHDGGSYLIQSSYTFLDAENRIVCPTSNNHVLMLRATDEEGNVLPEFEKVLDIDIKAAAEAALGKELTQNLLSVVFDYDGNLWFATGGFRIYPERQQQGVLGYIAHSAIEAILNGEQTDLSKAVFVYELTPGEGAENGIAASKDGAVILTNKNCYLLRANNGVEAVWCTPYESVGAKVSGEGDKTTGGGLAWGGGCSPTLTPNLVMFTDNADPVNLLALDMKTGEVVAKTPVLDDLPDGYQVAIENSAIVYDIAAATASEALQQATIHAPDVMLLDLGLPDLDGIEVIRRIRSWSAMPIIVISARSEDSDKIEALDSGADDYLTKPFSVEELLARLRVTFRRISMLQNAAGCSVFTNGDLQIDFAAGCATLKGQELHLTPIEYRLLCVMAKNCGKVLTHTYITHEVWGSSWDNDVASLRVFMATLRKKLESEPDSPQYIQTHIGIGYRMLKL